MKAVNHVLRAAAAVAVAAFIATACEPVPLDSNGQPDPAYACNVWAAPTGSDGAAGTQAAPVFSPAELAQRLSPGQTGCFTSGSYTFTGECRGCISRGGTTGNPITLRPAPGVRARDVVLTGQWWVRPGITDVVVRDLTLRESGTLNANLFIVSGDRVTLKRNDISNTLGICISAGTWDAYNATDNGDSADDLILTGNRIHDCGTSSALWHQDAGTSGWHGIYLSKADRATVVDNLIYNNKWRGLQTWPYVRNTVIERNVFDGNGSNVNLGSNLSEGFPWASSNVIVRNNILSNATYFRPDKNDASVHGNFPNDGVDRGNRVRDNCIHQPSGAVFSGYGFATSGNVLVDPQYANRAAADFRLASTSPCRGMGPLGIQPAS